MTFHLRPAADADLDFICRLRVDTMKDAIGRAYGWDEATQREYAEESLRGQIVVVDGRPGGVLTLADWGDQLHVVWIAVLPELQRQGLGGALIRQCQAQAAEAGKPLTLQVLSDSPAVTFYARFGFDVHARNGPHKVLMRWTPPTSSAGPIAGSR